MKGKEWGLREKGLEQEPWAKEGERKDESIQHLGCGGSAGRKKALWAWVKGGSGAGMVVHVHSP